MCIPQSFIGQSVLFVFHKGTDGVTKVSQTKLLHFFGQSVLLDHELNNEKMSLNSQCRRSVTFVTAETEPRSQVSCCSLAQYCGQI
jgi:hypothetical protein